MPGVSALHPPSLNLDYLLQVSEKEVKRGTTLEDLKCFSLCMSVHFEICSFFFSLESFFPVRCLGGTLAEGRESRTRLMLFFHSLYTLDSTKKVIDVLKLFEDGEMADYLQGDVSGSWEILSLTNSSHLCFCYSIGIPSFQRLSWATPCSPSLRYPSVHCYGSYCFQTKQDILLIQGPAQETTVLSWMLLTPVFIVCVPTTPNSSFPNFHPADSPG